MQILYVFAIVAVCVLCLALLSTARRILRSSPLASGQLALSSIYDVEQAEFAEDYAEQAPATVLLPAFDAQAESDFAIDAAVLNENVLPEAVPVEVFHSATPLEMPVAPQIHAFAPETGASEPIPAPRRSRRAQPSRRGYNYALECMLIGVSAWVLIKTQRGATQYRSAHPSHHRVA